MIVICCFYELNDLIETVQEWYVLLESHIAYQEELLIEPSHLGIIDAPFSARFKCCELDHSH